MLLRNGITGAKATYGTVAVLAPSIGGPSGVSARAGANNTGTVYWGPSSVGSDGSNAYGFLRAGEVFEFPVGNMASAGIYFIGSVAGQDVFFTGTV